MKALKLAILTVCLGMPVQAQQPVSRTPLQVQRERENSLYTLVVERTTKAINYRHHSGATKIDFRGTALLPEARGKAKVESKKGYIQIEVEFDALQPATRFGPGYLTYVMWAITPEGRATNLGELILNRTKSKLKVTTELQAFGLIVTAEPYFAVSQPSDVVVMENFIRKDTIGKIEEISAKYELLQRGQYTLNAPPTELKAIPLDKKTPFDLYEARNAVRIARWIGADKDAPESFERAQNLLRQAEAYKARKAGTKPIAMTAREAAQTAEDSRLIALKRQEEQRIALERQAAADREALAKAQADRAKARAEEEARRRAQAEAEQQLEAERRARAEAERAAAQALAEVARERALRDQAVAEQARQAAARAEAERAAALAQAEAERARALNEQAAAEQARQAAARAEAERTVAQARAEAERARALNEQAAAEQARQAAARAEAEKKDLRAQLIQQLNLVLDTRETARGLIINISDVLFDSGQFTLKPLAREKLARVSGIVLAHPGLRLEAEGHTDSVGSDEFNQQLSEKRAMTVRDFLAQQGIPITSLSSQGFGKTMPVAPNDTAAGRRLNRRVELVVAGDVIGIPLTTRP